MVNSKIIKLINEKENVILVLRGGGLLGLIQLKLIEWIYQQLNTTTLPKNIKIISGTSVGAINGAFLSNNIMSPTELIKMYFENGKAFFTPRPMWLPWNIVINIANKARFSRENIDRKIREYFGQKVMRNSACGLITTSVCQEDDKKTHYYKSWEEKDGQELISEVVLKSLSAPSFYPPYVEYIDDAGRKYLEKPKKTKVKQLTWVDGGTGVNNDTTYAAIYELKSRVKNDGWKYENSAIINIGTGYTVDNDNDFFDNITLARKQAEAQQVELGYSEAKFTGFEYYYANIEIPKEIDSMADYKLMDEFLKYGEKLVTQEMVKL